ncbi:hypothetical protein [uncultured Alcanivorax sp.]|jgi:hypothetical protein|uniref:hypothetical protein n=1 Tax=uncultured Alcanivorax sp. TaxID=191215 RepID=UPI0030DD44A1
MNVDQIKTVLGDIQYPVTGDDLPEVLESLHYNYPSQVVGSTVRTLGDADPLYVKAGQVAFLVDNVQDLTTACIRIRSLLKQRESSGPVLIQQDERSRYLPDIVRALEGEIDKAPKFKRPMGVVDTEYQIIYDPASRTQCRKGEQVIEDLLSSDTKRNQKAVEALQRILIIE